MDKTLPYALSVFVDNPSIYKHAYIRGCLTYIKHHVEAYKTQSFCLINWFDVPINILL